MLRERPFDIYTGQEDVLGLVIFFHDTILSFYFYVIRYSYLPKDNTKRTIAFNLSMIFFFEKEKIDLPESFFFFFEKATCPPHKNQNGRFLTTDFSAAHLLHSVIVCLE